MAWGYSMAALTAAQEAYPSGLLSLMERAGVGVTPAIRARGVRETLSRRIRGSSETI